MRKRGFYPKVLLKKWKKWIAGAVFAAFYIFATFGLIQNQQTLYVCFHSFIIRAIYALCKIFFSDFKISHLKAAAPLPTY